MNEHASPDERAVRRIVEQINESWRSGRYDEIGGLVADDVVIAPPGSGERIRGRAAYVNSYREYDAAATTSEFSSGEPEIDLVGDVAVAACPFSVVYELDGETHHENGRDLLVLRKLKDGWRIVWRTVQAETE